MKLKLSIRGKMFLWIAALSTAFVLISFLLNSLLFKPYYLIRQRKSFLAVCEELAENYREDRGELFEKSVMDREVKEGFMIALYWEKDGRLVDLISNKPDGPMNPGEKRLPPLPDSSALPFRQPPYPIFENIISEMNRLSEDRKYVFREMKHAMGSSMLSMYYKIDEDILLLVSRPMEPIDDSIAIAARFTFFTGVFFLLLGTGAALFMSKFITRPVKELTSIAESMAELDFSRKYEVNSHDELGELGRSINSLSCQLSEAIGKLNKMNSELLKEIEKERKIDEMRRGFIANVSHELRTPISLIEGYAEGLLDNVAGDREKRDSYCRIILDETQRMENHVNQLLNLSQLQSGVHPLEKSYFDIHRLTGEMVKKFEESGHLGTSRLRLIQEETPLIVHADKPMIEQVITNYLKNALRHKEGEEEITVRTERRTPDKIRVSVTNRGRPIEAEHLERIWESYYKVDKARTRKHGGYGLGLSIVKAIMDQHGNLYGVENLPGAVCFWFELDSGDIGT